MTYRFTDGFADHVCDGDCIITTAGRFTAIATAHVPDGDSLAGVSVAVTYRAIPLTRASDHIRSHVPPARLTEAADVLLSEAMRAAEQRLSWLEAPAAAA